MRSNGLTLDTGALIDLERRKHRAASLVRRIRRGGGVITVPTVVIAEWWRGQHSASARELLQSFEMEPLSDRIAMLAGEALAKVGSGPSIADAIVMASAAQRGDYVATGDFEDLDRLRAYFPNVRLVGLG